MRSQHPYCLFLFFCPSSPSVDETSLDGVGTGWSCSITYSQSLQLQSRTVSCTPRNTLFKFSSSSSSEALVAAADLGFVFTCCLDGARASAAAILKNMYKVKKKQQQQLLPRHCLSLSPEATKIASSLNSTTWA